MAPTIAAFAPVALAPGPLLGQHPVSPSAAGSQVSTPSSGRVQPTKLFIGGISRRTTTKQLRDHFSLGARVLDCVAMRTPDGRPRGFGYVTLDSPMAAQRFLAEPQNIDDRIVDMKLAVPEEQATKAVASRPVLGTAPSLMTENAMFYPQQSMFYPQWTEDAAFYYGNGFGGAAMADMGWQLPAVADPSAGYTSTPAHGDGPPALPDCVNLLTCTTDHHGQFQTWGQENQEVAHVATDFKNPLGEVTNLISNPQPILAKKPAAKASPEPILVKKLAARASPEQQEPKMLQPARVTVTDSFSPSSQPFLIFEDAALGIEGSKGDDEDGDEASTEPGALSPSCCGDLSPGLQELPSLGSAAHTSGECRRCNFFAKGRCQNGHNCDFCHFSHDRQKLTRQEKREQRAVRQVENTQMAEPMDTENAMLSQVPVRGPPGLSLPESPVAAPAPPPTPVGGLPGQAQPSPPGSFLLPSAAYTALPRMAAGMLSTCPQPAGKLLPSVAPSCLLSTNYRQPPVCTAKEMCTTATQTDDDFSCPHCLECGEGFEGDSPVCAGCSD